MAQCDSILETLELTTRPEPVGDTLYGSTWMLDLMSDDVVWTIPSSRPADAVMDGFVGDASVLLLHGTDVPSPELWLAFGEPIADHVEQFT